jgi:hypothetical protein
MEDLEVYKEDLGSRELNGRMHRWGYRSFQAKLCGLHVKYINPRNTSRTCPVCGSELKENSNGRRLMRCRRCGLEEDRDVVAVRNLTRRYYEEYMNRKTLRSFDRRRRIDVGSPRSPRKPPNERREEGSKRPRTFTSFLSPFSVFRVSPSRDPA